jgi:hypothetical protein
MLKNFIWEIKWAVGGFFTIVFWVALGAAVTLPAWEGALRLQEAQRKMLLQKQVQKK